MKFNAQMTCALSAATWHGMEWNRFLISACRRKFHIAYMHSQSSFFEAARRWITSRMPTNQIPHVLNRWHIWQISKPRKKLHVLGWNNLCSMCECIILLKDSSKGCLEGRERLSALSLHGCTCCNWDCPQSIANWIVHNIKSHPRP